MIGKDKIKLKKPSFITESFIINFFYNLTLLEVFCQFQALSSVALRDVCVKNIFQENSTPCSKDKDLIDLKFLLSSRDIFFLVIFEDNFIFLMIYITMFFRATTLNNDFKPKLKMSHFVIKTAKNQQVFLNKSHIVKIIVN